MTGNELANVLRRMGNGERVKVRTIPDKWQPESKTFSIEVRISRLVGCIRGYGIVPEGKKRAMRSIGHRMMDYETLCDWCSRLETVEEGSKHVAA